MPQKDDIYCFQYSEYFIEEINGINQSITTRLKTIRILEETIIVVNAYEFEVIFEIY